MGTCTRTEHLTSYEIAEVFWLEKFFVQTPWRKCKSGEVGEERRGIGKEARMSEPLTDSKT